METTIYLEIGQRWVRDGHDQQVRLVDIREHRWIVEDDHGSQSEISAGELRNHYRFASLS